MTIESFAMWLGITSAIIGIVCGILQFKLERILKTLALICFIILCVIGIWLLINTRTSAVSDSNQPSAPEKSTPALLAPNPGASGDDMQNLVAHISREFPKTPEYRFNDKAKPISFALPVTVLDADIRRLMEQGAKSEVSQDGIHLGFILLKEAHFVLARDKSSFDFVQVEFSGQLNNGEDFPKSGKPLKVPIQIPGVTDSPENASRFARQVLPRLVERDKIVSVTNPTATLPLSEGCTIRRSGDTLVVSIPDSTRSRAAMVYVAPSGGENPQTIGDRIRSGSHTLSIPDSLKKQPLRVQVTVYNGDEWLRNRLEYP